MRDYEEKSYYEIQLDNKQLILVFLAALTVCALIFILGVMVGKGQKEAELAAVTKVEPTPAKSEPETIPPKEAKSIVTPKTKEEEPAEPKQTQTSQDQYTFYDLDKSEPEQSTLKKSEEKEKPSTPAPTEVSATAAPPSAKQTPETVSPAPATNPVNQTARYTVQVMATASRSKADDEIKLLKSKGYSPFLDEYKVGNTTVYKVRVGKFDDSDSARAMASRLKKDLQLETWVAVLE